MSLAAGIGIATSLASLFGGSKNKPQYAQITDPTAGMSSADLDPVLADLFAAADRSGQQSWNKQFGEIQDAYQRRGLGGSGIEFQNISEAGRQQAMDLQALKQSYALELYKAWLARKQQEREWALNVAASQNQYNQSKAQQSGNFWSSLGQLGGYMMNKGFGSTTTTKEENLF